MVADGDQDLRHLNETAARLQAANTDASLLVEVSRRWRGLYFVATATETMGVYGDNDLKRAIIAMIGLGANHQRTPLGPLGVTMRLYVPAPEALDGRCMLPPSDSGVLDRGNEEAGGALLDVTQSTPLLQERVDGPAGAPAGYAPREAGGGPVRRGSARTGMSATGPPLSSLRAVTVLP
jgi:hypothetical protein